MRTMKNIQLFTLALCAIILSCSSVTAQTSSSYAVKTVVIDAGHGGKDPGACGKISQEKNITLAIALKVGSLIAGGCPDVKVIYTRKTDEFIELHRRADIANKAKADLFISVHVNANPNPEAFGTDSWTMGLAKNEANLKVAKMENDVISLESDASQYQGMSANNTEAIILHNLQQGAYSANSLDFADRIQNQFEKMGRKSRSVHQAPFLVLWKTGMPSVLIETGFITNAEEEVWLNNSSNQAEMAYAIYQAFLDYKNYIEKRTNGQIEKTTQSTSSTTTNTKQTQTTNQTAKQTQQHTTQTVSTENNPDIYYGVQIGAGNKLDANSENFKGLTNVYCVEDNGIYKYYYGKTTTYKEIVPLLNEAKKVFPEAFVVARDKNNKRLVLTEARNKTN